MELDDVGVVNISQSLNLPQQQIQFLFHFFFLDRFDCVLLYVWRRLFNLTPLNLLSGHLNGPKVSMSDDFSEFVILSNVLVCDGTKSE